LSLLIVSLPRGAAALIFLSCTLSNGTLTKKAAAKKKQKISLTRNHFDGSGVSSNSLLRFGHRQPHNFVQVVDGQPLKRQRLRLRLLFTKAMRIATRKARPCLARGNQ